MTLTTRLPRHCGCSIAAHMSHTGALVSYGHCVICPHDAGLGATLMVLIRGRGDHLPYFYMIGTRLMIPGRRAMRRRLDLSNLANLWLHLTWLQAAHFRAVTTVLV